MPAARRRASPTVKAQDAKAGRGRPSSYSAAYCDQAIEFMAGGYSLAGLAGEIGVARETIYDWARNHPEFSDALNRARAKAALFWEKRHIAIADGGEGNAAATIFALKNRASDQWRDRQELTGAEGKPLIPEADDLSVAKAIAFLLAKASHQESAA